MMTNKQIKSELETKLTQLIAQLNQMSLASDMPRTEEEWKTFDENYASIKKEYEEVKELLKYYSRIA